MVLNLNFTEAGWECNTINWNAWWSGGLERPLVMFTNRHRNREPYEWSREFLLETPIDAMLDYYQTQLTSTRYYGDAWPKWLPYFGAGVMAGFLGAQLFFAPDVETIWFEAEMPLDISGADLRLDQNSFVWQRVQALMQAAKMRWGDQVCIGYTDLGGNLDILASLRGTQTLLFDLYDAPDAVARLSSEITRLWLGYFDAQEKIIGANSRGRTPWAAIWAPGTCYMLQSDFAYMISPKMFERFVLPDLAACCEEIEYPFYHLDGEGQIRHLDLLLSLEKLRGIQWVPGDGAPPPEQWLPLLKRIRDGGKLCQLYVSSQGAKKIVDALGGQGFAFWIQDKMTEADAAAFLKSMGVS